MAMNCYLPALLNRMREDIHDFHHVLGCRGSHVLPGLVEEMDTVLVHSLWQVAEPVMPDEPISAVRVFARLLQVQDRSYVQLLELLEDSVLQD